MAEGSEIVEAADKTVEGSSWDWGAVWTSLAEKFMSIAGRLLICAVILIAGHFIIKFVTKKLLNSKKMDKLDPGVRGFIRTFVKILLNAILIISVVGVLGIPMASVVAVLGAAGAAIALALQGTLGNLASGIMLVVLRPFRPGIMPNGTLTTSTVINYSSEENRRVDMKVSAAYGSDVDKVKAVILDYAKREKLILDDPAPFVRMTDMSESSIDFTVRMWVKSKDYWDVRFNLSENIYEEFKKNNIHIPFKQLDIHVKK